MCSPASFETAYVQRASPTEPIVDTCPSSTFSACVPKTSLVEKSMKRSSDGEGRERGLERVVRADHVDAHRAHRALEHGVDTGDRRAMDEVRRAQRGVPERLCVEDVALDQLEVRMVGEIEPAQRVSMQVVVRDDRVAIDQLARQRRADEAGAAGDEDPLSLEHRGEDYLGRPRPPADGGVDLGRRSSGDDDEEHRADGHPAGDPRPDRGVPAVAVERTDEEPSKRTRRAARREHRGHHLRPQRHRRAGRESP